MRRRLVLVLVLVLGRWTGAHADDGEKRLLRLEWGPRPGERARLTDEARVTRKLTTRAGEAVKTDEATEARAITCDREVATVDSDVIVKETRRFTKAVLEGEGGPDKTLEGLVLTVERPRGEHGRVKLETPRVLGTLAGELVEELKGDPVEDSHPILPRGKVGEGEAWDVDGGAALQLLGDELGGAVRFDQVTGRARLVSVATKDGHPIATIEVTVTATIAELPSVGKVDRGTLTVTGTIEGCIDGSSADRTITVTGSLDATVINGDARSTFECKETLKFGRVFLP